MQTDISREDTHHPAMQAAGNAKGKKCKAAEDSGQEGWKEGVGSLHKVQQLAKTTLIIIGCQGCFHWSDLPVATKWGNCGKKSKEW